MPRRTSRRRAHRTAAVAPALGLLLALTSGADARAATAYSFSTRFTVPGTGNQQGLAHADGLHHVAFDTGGGDGQIVSYDDRGREVGRTPRLPLGHAAEVSYRVADGNLYVAVYGRPTSPGLHVAVVDMRPATPRLVRTYDFSHLGDRGMVAIDNTRDRMVLKSGPPDGPHTFTTTDMSGRVLSRFTDVSQGLGQGLEVHGDDLLLYTSAPGHTTNTITVYSLTGTIRSRVSVPVAREGEGLSVDRLTGAVHVGFADHTVRAMTPAYVPSSPAVPGNLLVGGGAEGSPGAVAHTPAVPLPSWSVTGGMTAIRYDAGTGGLSPSSPGPADRGRVHISGGTASTSTMTQTASTQVFAARIDSGAATYELSGWLGGYRTQSDSVGVVATFRDRTGASLGQARIGPVTSADRGGLTGLLSRATTGRVPVGTRTVRVVATATRAAGTHNDGYADSLRLTVR